MTDCSGIEAPVVALRQVRSCRLVAASEKDKRCREALCAEHAPQYLYPDMLRRELPPDLNIDLYCCGFPCTPFSNMHAQSLRFHDENARPLPAAIETIRRVRPRIAVLENVHGLERNGGTEAVIALLRKIPGYVVELRKNIDPCRLGFPIARRRLWFLLLRRDALNCDAAEVGRSLDAALEAFYVATPPAGSFDTWLRRHMGSGPKFGNPVLCGCRFDFMCPLHRCRCNRCHDGMAHSWQTSGLTFLADCGLRHGSSQVYFEAAREHMLEANLTKARERCIVDALAARGLSRGYDVMSAPAVVDLAQNLARSTFRKDGQVPCLIRNSQMFAFAWGRLLQTQELCALMGFPVVPSLGSDAALRHALGNSMHCAVVGVVLSTCLSLVEQS